MWHVYPKVTRPCHGVAMSDESSEIKRKVRAHRDLPAPAMRSAIRQDAGLSQEDFGAELGVTRAAVSRWETGDRRPRGDLLIAYSELLQGLRRDGLG